MSGRCTFFNTDSYGRCAPVAAVLEIDPYESGRMHSMPQLCFRHLNRWLDRADDQPWMEPTRLDFIKPPVGTELVRWLWWSHDPDGVDDTVGRIRITA